VADRRSAERSINNSDLDETTISGRENMVKQRRRRKMKLQAGRKYVQWLENQYVHLKSKSKMKRADREKKQPQDRLCILMKGQKKKKTLYEEEKLREERV